jgi:glycosyltransferase involved in cell wall biosynthesis
MKVLEVANVDFALRQFVLPLMRGLRARGHEVIGVSADGPMLDVLRAEGFRVVAVPMARSFSPLAQIRAFVALRRLIRAERPDLVHGHFPISGLLARVAARVAGVPRVAYTCHGYLFNQTGPWPKRALSLLLEWAAGRITDVYTTVSMKEAADARRLRIHRAAVGIGNGRDPAVFRPDPAARRRVRGALGVAPDRVVAVIVARLVREKGFVELLAALRGAPEVMLWVVGERLASDRGPDMRALFAAARFGERLRLLGYREDVPAVLAAADLFVLPTWYEALPMSVIEAMLSGLPVVASDVPGPREQVVHGHTGVLVPPRRPGPLAAALRRLAADPKLRARMGAAGRARALDLYDEARVVARTLDLLGA